MQRALFAALVFLGASRAPAQSQPPSESAPRSSTSPLTLAEVLRSSERHHPRVLAALGNVDIARADLMAAQGVFDPRLDIRASLRTGGYYELRRLSVQLTQATPLWGIELYAGYRIGVGVEENRYPSYYSDHTLDAGEFRVGARVPIWRGGILDARRAGRTRAEFNIQSSIGRQALTALALQQSATNAYFGWLAAGRRSEVAERLFELAQTRQAWVDARVAAGVIPAVDSLEAERSVLRRRTAKVSARRALERTALVLSLYVRSAEGTPSVPRESAVPQTLPRPTPLPGPSDGLERAALHCHPRISAKTAQLQAARVSEDLARSLRAPTLDATFEASRDIGDGPDSLQGFVFSAGLVFSLPLAMRSSRGRLAAAEARVRVLQEELRLIEDDLLRQIADARSVERNATEQYVIATELLDVSERLAAAEAARFRAGNVSLFIVNQREQALAETALAQVVAARELWRARAIWDAASTCNDSPRPAAATSAS